MPLPKRIPRPHISPGDHAGLLIHHARHGTEDDTAATMDEIWHYGRDHGFEVMFHLAVPIGTYYLHLECTPMPYYLFEVGSAERFAYGHVLAAMDGDETLATRLLKDFRKSPPEEFERAIMIMASAASESLYVVEVILGFELLTSKS